MRRSHIWAIITLTVVVGLIAMKLSSNPKTPVTLDQSDQIVIEAGKIYKSKKKSLYSGEIVDFHPNGGKSYSVTIVDGVLDGKATEWYESGNKKNEVHFDNGIPVGVLLGWHENGNPSYKVTLLDGQAEGITTEFYPSGEKKSVSHYSNGKKNGTETGYYKSRKPLWNANWTNNKLHGDYIKYYPGGNKKSIYKYVHGQSEGEANGWFETGEKSWRSEWADGLPVGTHMEWYKNGRPKKQKSYQNGEISIRTEWHNNGQKSLEAIYQNGIVSNQKSWDSNGTLELAMNNRLAQEPTKTPSQEPNDLKLGKPNPNAVGRHTIWSKPQLTKIYIGKSTDTILTTFGPPDKQLGDTWIYRNLTIIDPLSRRRFTTAQFLIKSKKVFEILAN